MITGSQRDHLAGAAVPEHFRLGDSGGVIVVFSGDLPVPFGDDLGGDSREDRLTAHRPGAQQTADHAGCIRIVLNEAPSGKPQKTIALRQRQARTSCAATVEILGCHGSRIRQPNEHARFHGACGEHHVIRAKLAANLLRRCSAH